MKPLTSLLSWLRDSYWSDGEEEELVVRVRDARHRYEAQRMLACGDAADIHLATRGGEASNPKETLYLLKVAREHESNIHLDIERKTLTRLLDVAAHTTYRNYLPVLADSFATTGRMPRRINVFRWHPGWHTLEQIHEQYSALEGRHLAWIFNRLLTVLGFCHRHNILHGAILPCHVLIHAPSHGLRLVGWSGSVAVGQRIRIVSARYQDWYPPEVRQQRPGRLATDLFLAARCLVYLAGGNPVTNRMPETVPLPFQRFLNTCLLDSAAMRPDDAWELMEDFDVLLQALYGAPKFHELTLT